MRAEGGEMKWRRIGLGEEEDLKACNKFIFFIFNLFILDFV